MFASSPSYRRRQRHSIFTTSLIFLPSFFENNANAWNPKHSSGVHGRHTRHFSGIHALQSTKNDASEEHDSEFFHNRRHILRSGVATAAAFGVGGNLGDVSPAFAVPTATTPTTAASNIHESSNLLTVPNLQCLTDLPPVTPGCVRIYLCRHGQTENNRLRRVQGARVDPSLNQYGSEMAARIGMALSYMPDDALPKVVVHSNLARARETAQIAAMTMSDINVSRKRTNAPQPDPAVLIDIYRMGSIDIPTGSELSRTGIKFDTLESLGEVDFGYDGMSVEAVRAGMYATYGSWAMGMIDRRMDGEGESGREVLHRAADALHSLAGIAKINGGAVLAVSHSAYLRTLLGAVMNVPLAQAANAEQRNGCINVLDVNVEGATVTLGPKSALFGGSLSIVKDFNLTLPQTNVMRTNECRHLEGITWPTDS